jgi:hypothetical protein
LHETKWSLLSASFDGVARTELIEDVRQKDQLVEAMACNFVNRIQPGGIQSAQLIAIARKKLQ